MLGARESLFALVLYCLTRHGIVWTKLLAFGGLHISHICTGTPFLALLTLPVIGVYLTGMSELVEPGMGLIGVLDGLRPAPVDDEAAEP